MERESRWPLGWEGAILKRIGEFLKRAWSVPAESRKVAPATLIMPLEPRIVYDASVAAVAVAARHPHPNVVERGPVDRIAPHSTALSHGNTAPIRLPAPERPAPVSQVTTVAASSPRNDLNPTREWLAAAQSHLPQSRLGLSLRTSSDSQVVFIDPNVTGYQSLVSGLPPGTRYVVLNPNEDGLQQIASYLQSHPGVDAIHLVSHGSEGQVEAGKTLLDLGDLSAYSAELAQIGAAMKPGGDFLIYGCDVAEGADGQALVQQIAELTHLKVAASTHLVGATSLGGSWALDYDVGGVRTPVIFSAAAEQQYQSLFSVTVENFTSNPSYDSGATSSFTLDGITYTITKTGPLASNVVVQDLNLQLLPDETGFDNALLFDENGVGGISSITISMADGKAFNIQSLDIDAIADANITFLADGQSTTVSLASNGSFVTQTVNLSTVVSAFANVTSLTIQGGNLEPALGHIVYSEITPPTVTTTGGATTFTSVDSSTGTRVVVDSGLTVSNTEATTGSSATVSITGNFRSGQDVLAFTNTNGTTYGNIVGSYNSNTGVLSLSSSGSTATTAQWQHALDAVTYLDTAAAPNTSSRTVSFTFNDGIASSTAATKTVNVDSPPIVTTTGGTTGYVGGTSATAVDSGVTVTDPSQITQSSGVVAIAGGFHSGDTLAFTNISSALFGNISGSFNSATGILTLTSPGGTATDTQWTHALEAIAFSSTSTTYGNRTISFTVNDGTDDSAAATKTVGVTNPAPVVTTDSGSAAFVAGDNVASTPVAVDSGLTFTHPGASTLGSATVAITGNFHSGEDVLSFINTSGATYGNISASYFAGTGVLTLTSSGNSATAAQWQAALDAVTYTDTAVTPNSATRTVSFSVTDVNGNPSSAATRTVTVADTDQTPIVTSTGGTTANYVGSSSAVTIDGGVTVSDLDNTTQVSGRVAITGGFHSGDTLSFTNTSSAIFGNISASYNSGTGVLTLTSAGATATDAQWANVLDSVTFSSTSTTYSNRTVAFAVTDGTNTSVAATDTVNITAPPILTADSGSAAFVAGDNVTSTPIAIDAGLTLTDGSATTLGTAIVAITGNFTSGEDVLAFTNDGSTMGNVTGSYNGSTGVLTLTSAGATATLAQWQAVLDSVTYTDTAVTPNNSTRTVSFTVVDGAGNTSNTATRTVTVTDTDQTPTVTTTGGTTSYLGGTSATTIDGGVSVFDRDNTTLASGSVSITSGFDSGDTLSFTNNGFTMGNISASYNSGTGVLTLTSAGATATRAQWAHAFEAVTFFSTITTYGNRTVSFVVNDGTVNSAAATQTVDMLDPNPVVTTDSGSAAFVAGDNVTSTPVAIDSGLTVTDPATSTLASATISITGNFQSGEDVLSYTNDGSTMGNISGSYNASTGVLTLTSTGATGTLAQWQSAMEAVTYTDTAVTPNSATRTVSFTVDDSNFNTSNMATRTVTVTDTDQTPIVGTTGGTTNYVGGTSATAIDAGITVSDLDNTTQTSGTVSITGGFHSGDTLTFTNTSSTLFGNISASYSSGTGVLTLTSSGATATDAQWANAFSAITFSAGANVTPGNRTVSFVVSDGTENSSASTDTVNVLGPPTITTDSGSAAFVAGDNVTSTPVVVDAGLTVTDGSSPTLASATIAIMGNFHSGEDVLVFTNSNSATFGNIAGSYNTGTGVLTLTSSGATATLAQWQAALDAVTYTDTAITPNSATRTISFTATDANSNTSNTATRTVTVTDTDQTPILTTTSGTTSYIGGTAPVAIDSGMTVSDLDNATQSSGTVSVSVGFNGGDTLSFMNTSSILYGNIVASYNSGTGVLTLSSSGATATDAQWQSAFDAVTFSAASVGVSGNRTISFVVNDGTESSTAGTQTVSVINSNPVITTDTGSAAFVAGDNVLSTPVAVDPGITVVDVGSSTLQSATVAMTGNFHAGEDVLSFTNDGSTMGNITSSYNATTGVLTLTSAGGTATLAQWRTAFQELTYTDTAITPDDTTRTISFTATDGNGITGSVATRTVTVQDTDQTPIVTTTGATASYVGGTSTVTPDTGVSVSDRDNPTLAAGTVSIGAGFNSGDTLSFTNSSATLYGNITASYDATTGVLTLTSAGATATDAQWASAFDAVSFSAATTAAPGNRTISYVVNDGAKDSVPVTDTVALTAPPIVTADTGSAAFIAGDNVISTPVVIDSGLTLSDASSATLSAATVSIAGNFHGGEDVLAFTNDGSTMGNIIGSYNATTSVLTLTSAGGTATLAQWQAAFQEVTYTDTAITPDSATRTISFTVTDSNANSSNAATRTVTVQDTDQTPVVTTTAGSTAYQADSVAKLVDSGVTVGDRDNSTLASATISITGGFENGDRLSLAASSAQTIGNITGSYDASTGVLTLTSSGATATLAQWQQALASVQFAGSASSVAGTRTVSYVVNDATEPSAPVARAIVVQQAAFAPPVVQPEIVVVASQGGGILQVVPAEPIVVEALDSVHAVGTTFSTGTVAFFGTHGTDMSGVLNESSVTEGGMDVPVWVAPPLRSVAPALPTTLESFNVNAGESFTLTLVSGVEVELADGSPLPEWLHYDSTSGVLKGTPPADAPKEMRLITTVHRGAAVVSRHVVTIDIGAHKTAPLHRSTGHRSPPHADLPAAKPSLAEQFARQRGKLHVARAGR